MISLIFGKLAERVHFDNNMPSPFLAGPLNAAEVVARFLGIEVSAAVPLALSRAIVPANRFE